MPRPLFCDFGSFCFVLLFSAVIRIHSFICLTPIDLPLLDFGQNGNCMIKQQRQGHEYADKPPERVGDWSPQFQRFVLKNDFFLENPKFHCHYCCCCCRCRCLCDAVLKMIALGRLGVAFINFFLECHHHRSLQTHTHALIFWLIVRCVFYIICVSVYLFFSMDEHRFIYCFPSACNALQKKLQTIEKKCDCRTITTINFAYKNCQQTTFALLIVVSCANNVPKNRLPAKLLAVDFMPCHTMSLKRLKRKI